MDIIDGFLTDHATPERRDLLMDTHNHLMKLGHIDHELNIENFVAIQGDLDNAVIILLIENELLNACHDLTLKYFVVCRKIDTLNPYLSLLEFLTYLEETIESETIIYHHNDELAPREQLLSWVDVFRNDLSVEISDLILEVMQSLIDNILEIHELKVDIQPIEHDALYHKKIQCLKAVRDSSIHELLAVNLIKSNTLTTTYSLEELNKRYSKMVYALDNDNDLVTSLNIISLAIMSPNDMGSINHDSKTLANMMYDDVKKTSVIVGNIDAILNQAGELCKTMNTI